MTSRSTILAVVVALGLIAVLGLLGTVYLVNGGKDASNIAIVAGLAGTATGALAGVLASTRSEPMQPMPVNVINPPADPVNVEEKKK